MHLETRVLVTGGAGFLGSHLCEELLKQGATVICVDNFFTGTRRNIDRLLDHHGFRLLILPETEIARVPQHTIAGHFRKGDFSYRPRSDPMGPPNGGARGDKL